MSAKGMQATVLATMIHAAREQDGHSALHFGPAMTALIREMAEATVAPPADPHAPCDVPPSGWECSRKKGHEGPCAADQTKLEAVTQGLLAGEGSTDDWKTFTSALTAAGMTTETAEAVLGRTVTQPRQQTPAWEDGVKELAQTLDPECWVSYSGKPKHVKQYMEGRRVAALNQAREQIRGGS